MKAEPPLRPVSLPDLSTMTESAQKQIREAHGSLTKTMREARGRAGRRSPTPTEPWEKSSWPPIMPDAGRALPAQCADARAVRHPLALLSRAPESRPRPTGGRGHVLRARPRRCGRTMWPRSSGWATSTSRRGGLTRRSHGSRRRCRSSPSRCRRDSAWAAPRWRSRTTAAPSPTSKACSPRILKPPVRTIRWRWRTAAWANWTRPTRTCGSGRIT